VSFRIDGVSLSTDASAPFDLNGTSSRRAPCRGCAQPANPFESNLLSLGDHTIAAEILRRDGSFVTLSATFTVSGTVTHTILVSTSPTRSAPAPLDGAVLSGPRYVFLGLLGDPIAGARAVTFRLDGRRMGTESTEPYDLLGGRRGTAQALNTRVLRDGEHRITAQVTLAGGGVITYTAVFQVDN
jgi:hypothetical protein